MSINKKLHVAVACGGTGGHIFPGLATAEAMRERGHEVTLWLAGRDVEALSVADWPGRTERVRASGFPSGVNLRSLANAFRMICAVWVCFWRLRSSRPDVVLAMGSYASVGPVLAARLLGVPIVLHEANAVPGRAISFLSRFSRVVALAFAEAAKHFPSSRTARVGFPLRRAFAAPGEPLPVEGKGPTLLIMGGSQGAHALNECGVDAVLHLQSSGWLFNVIHLAGRQDADLVETRYRDAGVSARVFGFLQDMPAAYRAADLAISRAGAASCSELAACGLPAILIPLPSALRDHQTANARQLEACGGARLLPQSEMTVESLSTLIQAVLDHEETRERMRESLREWGAAGATDRLADLVEREARS